MPPWYNYLSSSNDITITFIVHEQIKDRISPKLKKKFSLKKLSSNYRSLHVKRPQPNSHTKKFYHPCGYNKSSLVIIWGRNGGQRSIGKLNSRLNGVYQSINLYPYRFAERFDTLLNGHKRIVI